MALDATDFNWVKQIDITSCSGAYQMELWVYSGNGTDDTTTPGHIYCNCSCASWPNDIRFGTTNNPDTAVQLDMWYESGATSTAPSSHIWIETPDPSSATFYMFISSITATLYDSGAATFLFYEDWNSQSIDATSKWAIDGTDGSVTYSATDAVKGYVQRHQGDAGNKKYHFRTQSTFGRDTAARFRAKLEETSASYQITQIGWQAYGNEGYGIVRSNQGTHEFIYEDGDGNTASNTISNTHFSTWKTYDIKRGSDVVTLYVNGEGVSSGDVTPHTYEYNFRHYCRDSEFDIYSDWLLLRKYISGSKEPSWNTFGSWTKITELGIISVIVTNASGALYIDNIYPSATITGKITAGSGTCFIYWGSSDGGDTKTAWEMSSNIGLCYSGQSTEYFTSSAFQLRNTGYKLSSATTYYYRIYGSSNGWEGGEDWAPSSAEWTTKSAFKLYFVSGTTSSTPITPSTDGYLGSSNVVLNNPAGSSIQQSGSILWDNLFNRTWKWHAYLNSSTTWSDASSPWGFSIPDYPSNITFYWYRDSGPPPERNEAAFALYNCDTDTWSPNTATSPNYKILDAYNNEEDWVYTEQIIKVPNSRRLYLPMWIRRRTADFKRPDIGLIYTEDSGATFYSFRGNKQFTSFPINNTTYLASANIISSSTYSIDHPAFTISGTDYPICCYTAGHSGETTGTSGTKFFAKWNSTTSVFDKIQISSSWWKSPDRESTPMSRPIMSGQDTLVVYFVGTGQNVQQWKSDDWGDTWYNNNNITTKLTYASGAYDLNDLELNLSNAECDIKVMWHQGTDIDDSKLHAWGPTEGDVLLSEFCCNYHNRYSTTLIASGSTVYITFTSGANYAPWIVEYECGVGIQNTVQMDTGVGADNHYAPIIFIDKNWYIHIMHGAHDDTYTHLSSQAKLDVTSWGSNAADFSGDVGCTYGSFTSDFITN